MNVQFKLRQQLALNDRLQNKLAGLQANKESVQQHRHEANRCLDALEVVQGEKRQMQKRMDELEAAAETANARCVCLSACYVCLLYTSPSPRDYAASRMPSSA